jgi:16S rRNA (uracil1498-N3)-methyltransferase
VVPRSSGPGSAAERRFFLAPARPGSRPQLAPGDLEHALRVLRLGPGDRLVGLDGAGGSTELEVARAGRGTLELNEIAPVRRDPAPGETGAPLPWIEVAVPWPKGGRAEEMLDRLTQLGIAAIAPLGCERAGPHAGELPKGRRDRLDRVLREACKQSGRTWLPLLREQDPTQGDARLEAVLLDPGALVSLPHWVLGRVEAGTATWNSARPLLVLVGPEGGCTEAERSAFLTRGAQPVRLGPHVLRVETAAEAAAAVLTSLLVSARRS